MVFEASPFRPGMGRVPPAMSGRDEVLSRYQAWFGTKNSHGEVAIVEGHRGVGKTSLLKVIGAQAVSADWVHLHLETTEAATLETLLADVDLHRLLDELGRLPRIGRRLKELSAELKLWGIGAAVSASAAEVDRPRPRVALSRFATRCEAAGMGLLLTIDEIQRASKDLAQQLGALANASVPIVHVWAGLPGTRRRLQTRGVTASERARSFQLGSLNEQSATEALVKPFSDRGVTLEPTVAARVFAASLGYPYFIQLYGDELWQAHQHAGYPGTIDTPISIAAERAALVSIDRFFQDRLDAMTPRAQEALIELVAAGGNLPTSELAQRLGLGTASFSERRAELLQSGLAASSKHGQVEVTFPALHQYLSS